MGTGNRGPVGRGIAGPGIAVIIGHINRFWKGKISLDWRGPTGFWTHDFQGGKNHPGDVTPPVGNLSCAPYWQVNWGYEKVGH